MARSVAAIAFGFTKFDAELRVGGVLFNRVASEGHYQLLKEAVESKTDIAVVGYLRPDQTVTLSERHLGLVTAIEQGSLEWYERFQKIAADTIDLESIERLALSADNLGTVPSSHFSSKRTQEPVRIGVAYDQAFCFYYHENLDLLEREGAKVVKFSPLDDQLLPDVDMLYLGGGYPELFGGQLSKNVAMREAIRSFAACGRTIYAECGGMMYLTRAIHDFDGHSHEMVGLFPAEAVMQKSSMTLGYRTLECARHCILGEVGLTARGHEFHYSKLVPSGPLEYACRLSDAQGLVKGQDGLVTGNVLALYTHLHFASQPQIAKTLLASARRSTPRSPVTTRDGR